MDDHRGSDRVRTDRGTVCGKKIRSWLHGTPLLYSGDHEHVHHGEDRFHDGVYAACDAAVSPALYPQTKE